MARLTELRRERQAEVATCHDMDDKGDWPTAKRRLENDLLQWCSGTSQFDALAGSAGMISANDPDQFADPLMDIEMEHGDYIDAYKVSAGLIKRFGFGHLDVKVLARASLAAAMLGNVFQGQRPYLASLWAPRAHPLPGTIDFSSDIDANLPKGESPREVACLSAIAVAQRCPQNSPQDYLVVERYYELALRLEPGNPYACHSLADCYGDDPGRLYSKAISTATTGLTKAVGAYRSFLAGQVSFNEYRLKRWGDGKPVYVPPAMTKQGP